MGLITRCMDDDEPSRNKLLCPVISNDYAEIKCNRRDEAEMQSINVLGS